MPNLADKKWSKFRIDSIFEIVKGRGCKQIDLIDGNNIYVSAKNLNNGIVGFCGNTNEHKKGSITISDFGKAFVQPKDFSGTHIVVLNNNKIGYNAKQFICQCIEKAFHNKYSFGYAVSVDRLKKQSILLPVNKLGEPDYLFMEEYMKYETKKYYSMLKNFIINDIKCIGERKIIKPLNEKKHLPFKLGDLGTIRSGIDIYQDERIEGKIPYITAGTANNGIGYFISNMNGTYEKNYISINRNGAVGESFYHEYYSLLGNDCRKFVLNEESKRNRFVYLFISTVIAKQKTCFSYSRKLGTERAKNLNIMLPVKNDNSPDYEYMEQYVKNNLIDKYNRLLDFIAD